MSDRCSYSDLTACSTCSNATAPQGSLTFVLTSFESGVGSGKVTATSDAKNWAVGAPVSVTISNAAPGRFLNLTIGNTGIFPFCDQTAAGQCGA